MGVFQRGNPIPLGTDEWITGNKPGVTTVSPERQEVKKP
jgi:hypothetical protein